MNINLDPDGPHSGEHSREAGRVLEEAIKYLCHATRSGAGGLEDASDADSVLHSLAALARGLPQLLTQVHSHLAALESAGRLADDQHRDPRTQVATAAYGIGGAVMTAQQMEGELAKVTEVTSSLITLDGTDDHA